MVGAGVDGVEALVETTRLKPDVVVMDITMPRLDGIRVAQQIRRNGISSRIVIIPVNEGPDIIARAFESGAIGYVIKSRLSPGGTHIHLERTFWTQHRFDKTRTYLGFSIPIFYSYEFG